MPKAKVGTGNLEPFKKSGTGSESRAGSTNKEHVREGFTENVSVSKVGLRPEKSEPFDTGYAGPGPGHNQNMPRVPSFHDRANNGIPDMPPPFKD